MFKPVPQVKVTQQSPTLLAKIKKKKSPRLRFGVTRQTQDRC